MSITSTPQSPVYMYQHTPEKDFCPQSDIEALPYDKSHTFVDKRSCALKSYHGFVAVLRDIKFIFLMVIEVIKNIFRKKEDKAQYLDCTDEAKMAQLDTQPSDMPVLFVVPGLGDPNYWGQMLKRRMAKETPGIEVRVIKNQKNGNQDFKKTVEPILKMIRKYCDKNPNKPIALTGVSLGGRTIHYIEQQLRKSHPGTEVLVYSMAAAFRSKFATKMYKAIPCIAKLFVNEDLLKRFSKAAKATKELIDKQNKALPEGCKRTLVCAMSANDTLINDANGLPRIKPQRNLEVINKVAYRCSHLGVVSVCSKDLQKTVKAFFNERNVVND